MRFFEDDLKKTTTSVSAVELKQLLALNINKSMCFRFRAIGEMWIKNFVKVLRISDKSAVVFDETENRHLIVTYNQVMQFEMDERFQNYQPYFHYNVTPSPELD